MLHVKMLVFNILCALFRSWKNEIFFLFLFEFFLFASYGAFILFLYFCISLKTQFHFYV